MKKTILLAVACATAAVSSNAYSQESDGGADEIVVTAQRRAENLQDVPVAVSAFSADQIEALQLVAPASLSSVVPNLQVTAPLGDGVPIFSLRGISMTDFSVSQNGPIAVYHDDVYRGNSAILGLGFYDLERVEVLRGPQGTLYGRNSTGGAINLISRAPGFTNSGNLSLGLGNFNRYQASGAGEFTIADVLSIRGAFTWEQADGWYENLSPGREDLDSTDQFGFRGSIRYQPNERLDVILRATTSRLDPTAYGIASSNAVPEGIGFPLLYPATAANGDPLNPIVRAPLIREGYAPDTPNRRTRADTLSLTVNYDLSDDLALTSISSSDRGSIFIPEDSDGTELRVTDAVYSGRTEQFSQELRLTSDFDGPLNFILGAYYNREQVHAATSLTFGGDIDFNADNVVDANDCIDSGFFACQFANSFDQEKVSTALFADITYRVNERLSVRGGLRYTSDEGDLEDLSAVVADIFGSEIAPTIPPTDLSFSEENISGRIGVDYDVSNDAMVYASYSTGYRGAAFNAQALFDASEVSVAEPENVSAVEIGFKSEFFDRALRVNGAAFSYRYENQQVLNVDPVFLTQTLINLPESRLEGLELDVVWRATDRLSLNSSLGLLESSVERGLDISGVDVTGNQLQNSPSVTWSGGIDWTIPLGSSWSAVAHLDGAYTASQFHDIQNRPTTEEGSYSIFNGNIRFLPADGRYSLTLWARNLTDETYRTNIIDVSAAGYLYTHINPPLTYGVTFDVDF